MQTTNPTEHGYVSGNGLLIHNQSSHTPEWKTYLQGTHNFNPPMDEHKTFLYSSNQRTEMFSVRSRLNLISFYSLSGKYEVNMTSCLTELVDILSRIFVSSIPNQKVLNMVGYKLLVYLPESIQPPFGFIRDELYTYDFLGGVLQNESLRLYIRNFQYNEQLGLHALPCNDFEYNIMSSFYKLSITSPNTTYTTSNASMNTTPNPGTFGTTPLSLFGATVNTIAPITTPNTSTYNSGTFGTTPNTTSTSFGYNIFSKK